MRLWLGRSQKCSRLSVSRASHSQGQGLTQNLQQTDATCLPDRALRSFSFSLRAVLFKWSWGVCRYVVMYILHFHSSRSVVTHGRYRHRSTREPIATRQTRALFSQQHRPSRHASLQTRKPLASYLLRCCASVTAYLQATWTRLVVIIADVGATLCARSTAHCPWKR